MKTVWFQSEINTYCLVEDVRQDIAAVECLALGIPPQQYLDAGTPT
jgi:hypothetical protein